MYAIAISVFTYAFLALTMAGAFNRITLAYDQDFYSKATAWSVRVIDGGEATGLWGKLSVLAGCGKVEYLRVYIVW